MASKNWQAGGKIIGSALALVCPLAMPSPALAMDFGGLRRITRRARALLGLEDAAVVT